MAANLDTPLSGSVKRQLVRELAAGDVTRADLARVHGVTRAAITLFAKRNQAEIDAIKARLTDEFAGLWIASKGERIAAYQQDYEMSLDNPRADHYEQIRTRTQIKQAVAEELGQLPPRQQTLIMPVVHVVQGVDLGDLT